MFRNPLLPIPLAILISYCIIGKFSGNWNPIVQIGMLQIVGSTWKVALYVAFIASIIGLAQCMILSFLTNKRDYENHFELNIWMFAYFNLMILTPVGVKFLRDDPQTFPPSMIAIVGVGYLYLVVDLLWSRRKMVSSRP